ncbi:MAG TPA: UDP-N-acetylglucosamine 1-carboxyvinyltransferase [Ktedonobacterales bacterium]|nr:UDP-N-acetylglucosamine 1-carboxyvinyltransferase [Ktedonobacterales bacterium]
MERAKERQGVHQRMQRQYRAAARVAHDTLEMGTIAMDSASGDGHESRQDSACYLIEGGIPLKGEVHNSGAKNAATKLMVAALLTEDRCTLGNMPAGLGDVTITEEVLRSLGAEVTWPDESKVSVRAADLDNTVVPLALGRKNRLAVMTTGPLLHRAGHAVIPAPGGDRIGPRPINFHLDGLQRMGASLDFRDGLYHLSTDRLKGAAIELPFPSVMATETLIIAATLARGVTVISNAAIEPEIIDLIKFLQKMGAIIEQRVDRKIVIEGVQRLHGADHRVITDNNEAVSLAIAAYLTHGNVRVIGAEQGALLTFLNTLYRVGLDFTVEDDAICFFGSDEPPRPIALETDVHPGFKTDWQQPFTLLLTRARGMSVIHETIYEDRFGYTQDLNRMGADTGLFTRCLGELPCRFRENEYHHSCVVRGPTPLHAAEVTMPDIRAGAAYILAALCAKGTSTVHGIEHIERGYDHLDAKLRSLGAHIERVPTER